MMMASLLLTLLTAEATEKTITSPNGKMTVTISDEGGRPTYQVTLDGAVFLERSPLGVKLNFDDLTQGLSLKDCQDSKMVDE